MLLSLGFPPRWCADLDASRQDKDRSVLSAGHSKLNPIARIVLSAKVVENNLAPFRGNCLAGGMSPGLAFAI